MLRLAGTTAPVISKCQGFEKELETEPSARESVRNEERV